MSEQPALLTIGHSHHSLEHFLDLLRASGVQAVADVRSWPRSRYAPQFNAEPLKQALLNHEIKYVFLGRELGGRPDDPQLYDSEGHVLYDRVAMTAAFAQGLDRVLAGAATMRVAVMCAEEDPTNCHRRLLVARVALDQDRARVFHIRGDGHIDEEHGFAASNDGRLFEELSEIPWRSTQSVLRRRVPSASSVA